jgi:hypothetical protein
VAALVAGGHARRAAVEQQARRPAGRVRRRRLGDDALRARKRGGRDHGADVGVGEVAGRDDEARDALAQCVVWLDLDHPELIDRTADLVDYAQHLYSDLRAADARGAGTIVAVLPPPAGLGHAIRDRLMKAAAHRAD